MGRSPDEARRRHIGIILVAVALLLFIAQMVALALGSLEIAALIFLIFVAGWFALRSHQRRRERGGA
jgi:Flp pilus assembly protein TadB